MLCPQCDKHIQWARMIEPLEQMSVALQGDFEDDMMSSPRSSRQTESFGNRSRSTRSDELSHSTSLSSGRVDSTEPPLRPQSSALVSPLTEPLVATFGETLFSPLASQSAPLLLKRQSVSYSQPRIIPPAVTIPPVLPPPTTTTIKKPLIVTTTTVKPAKKTLGKSSTGFKGKSSKHIPLPSSPSFAFSNSGTSLLLWGRGREDHGLVRFNLSVVTGVFKDGCVYDVPGVETAAVGENCCVVVASNGEVCPNIIHANDFS